jgi:hypothetical protein
MKYRVIVHRFALQDLDDAYIWAARYAPDTAADWLRRFQEAIQTLGTRPRRCGRAHEQRKVAIELREYHFGASPNVFRVVFTIDGDAVRVLRIVRAQRRPLTGEQIRRAAKEQ